MPILSTLRIMSPSYQAGFYIGPIQVGTRVRFRPVVSWGFRQEKRHKVPINGANRPCWRPIRIRISLRAWERLQSGCVGHCQKVSTGTVG